MNAILLAAIAAALLAVAGYAYWRKRTALYMPAAPSTLRTDLRYGYYGRDRNQCDETAGAVNLAVELRWDSLDATIERMRRQPVPTILTVSSECWINATTLRPDADVQLRATLDALRSAGVIGQVIGFYVIDEPDLWGSSDADVTAACATVRKVAADYADLGGCILACCYSKSGRYPGVTAFDWVGVDDYPEDSNMLTGAPLSGLRSVLRDDQRIFLVPGGCDPFRGSPEAFRRAAHSDPKVAAIIPFLWIDYDDPQGKRQKGIRNNGMDAVYRKLGAEIVGASHG